MTLRILLAPWWVRWALATALIAVLIGGFYLIAAPRTAAAFGPLWGPLALGAFSMAFGAALLALRQPERRQTLAIIDGLDPGQRRRAVAVLRRGPVPEDPAVVAAALRLGAMAEFQRRRLRWPRAVLWVIAAGCVAIGVAAVSGVVATNVRTGWADLVLGTGVLAVALWSRWRWRRLEQQMALLRAAATPAAASGADGAATATRSVRWSLLTVLAGAAVVVAPLMVWPAPARSAQCRTAHAVVSLIYEQRNLLTAPQNHSVAEFRRWSAQLARYAGAVDDPEIAPRVRRIAELADDLVAGIEHDGVADAATLAALVEQDQQLNRACQW